jgi:8-oxo-dGTP pyrophosphatase MutT (NUDIX family)
MRHFLLRLRFWLYWPGVYLYFHGSRRSRVVLVDGTKLLLVQDRFSLWFDESAWAVPGGGIRADETPQAAAVRELHEELGISLRPSDLRMAWEGPISSSGLSYYAHFFIAELAADTPLKVQKTELRAAQWFDRSTLPAGLKHEARLALRLLAEQE